MSGETKCDRRAWGGVTRGQIPCSGPVGMWPEHRLWHLYGFRAQNGFGTGVVVVMDGIDRLGEWWLLGALPKGGGGGGRGARGDGDWLLGSTKSNNLC